MKTLISLVMSICLSCFSGIAAADGGSHGPGAMQLAKSLSAKYGLELPQANNTYMYLYDLVTNIQGGGWGSTFVLTNYSDTTRIHIVGAVIPLGANPGSEALVDEWLNPYEVRYVDMSKYLGNTNGWALIWCVGNDFGTGEVLYRNTSLGYTMTWIKPWGPM